MATGKWIGGALGWILGGGSILGAIVGFCIGSLLDDASEGSKSDNGSNFNGSQTENGYGGSSPYGHRPFEEGRNSFLFSMLVLSSYVIKADGKVMHSEMEFVRGFLRENFGEQAVQQGEEILLKLFEMQKQQGPALFKETIRKSCVEINMHLNSGQRLQLLNYLVIIAKADGYVSPEEVAVLKEVAGYLRLSSQDVDSMLNMGGSSSSSGSSVSINDAYKILGISPDATDDEVKAAYRKMALKHHPDRVATLGDDIKKTAEKKFQEINDAKERIFKARGL
ncbi:DnaJ domain-containing protein [Prevotella sp. HUN102]|uniref:DnaJ domain-containing protein n=1 Tax=Prevotella sp. HUN102 TaxID=1392486 RepID=UPI000490FBC0|nr:DnaJ domain-containing protein [Prevotella sp. HUN102]